MTLVEQLFDADLEKEEDRYAARETISALLRPWFAARTLSEVREALNAAGACWGPYQTFTQAVHEDPRISTKNPMFKELDQPSTEERRGGKECGGTCRSWWSSDH